MTARQREAVRLRIIEGLTYREVGHRLGGVTVERARQLVKAGLKPPPAPPQPIPQAPLTDDAVWALFLSIDELELSVRVYNRLRTWDWSMPRESVCVGDLALLTVNSFRGVRNFGKKSLDELQQTLARLDLRLGMTLPGWALLRRSGARLRWDGKERVLALYDPSAIKVLLGLNDGT